MSSQRKTYLDKIVDAIVFLNDGKKGSSKQKIEKFVCDKYSVTNISNKINRTLVDGVRSEDLTRVRGSGARGSFCLGKKRQKQVTKKKKMPKNSAVRPSEYTHEDYEVAVETEQLVIFFSIST
jgi:hypothetical protein